LYVVSIPIVTAICKNLINLLIDFNNPYYFSPMRILMYLIRNEIRIIPKYQNKVKDKSVSANKESINRLRFVSIVRLLCKALVR
jgi:hypothetical protein